jgi:hypothetical protein
MSAALKYFASIDDSTRSNILINCSELVSMFNEEEMKCIDYNEYEKNKYNNWYSYNLKKNVNVCLSLNGLKVETSKDKEMIINDLIYIVEEFQPVYFITIKGNEMVDIVLKKYNYNKIGNKFMLHIYLNQSFLMEYNQKKNNNNKNKTIVKLNQLINKIMDK